MRFAALNKEEAAARSERSARSEAAEGKTTTREAQESRCLQRYREAISLQQGGEGQRARDLYQEILDSRVMQEAGGSSGTMQRLKYLSLKNIGSIARSRGDDSTALDTFIQAVGVGGGEVTVWVQLAQCACSLGNLLLARTALQEAGKCHALHWPAVDLLCSVLLALNDTTACLQLISEVLPHCPHYPRGLAYLHHLTDTSPDLLTFMPGLRLHLMKPRPPETEKLIEEALQLTRKRGLLMEVKILEDPIKPPKPLAYYSLHSLGQSLIMLYRYCQKLPSPSLTSPIDLRQLCEGTSELPHLITQAPPTSSEEVDESEGEGERRSGGEGERRSGGEVERREGKRKTTDILQAVLPKRRSTRVKSRRVQVSASDRFARFLPDHLRGCEFGDVCALSPLPTSGDSAHLSLSDQSDCSVLSQPRLSNDVVKTYLQDHQNNSGVISLIYHYLLLLAQHYNWQWTEASFSVVRMYIELYELVQTHLTLPSPLCTAGGEEYSRLQDMAMICLCYSELKVDGRQKSSDHTHICHALSFCQLASGGPPWRGKSEFTLRINWCVYKMRESEGNMSAAASALRECLHLLQERECLPQVLPNLRHDPCISPGRVSQKMKSMEQVLASEEVHALFQSGDHCGVVSRLRPMLEWKSDNYSQFLLGVGGASGRSPLSTLLLSLLALQRWQECLEVCVTGLQELLVSYKLGNELWVSALNSTYTHLDRCLEEGPGELVRGSGERLQRHLAVCVFRTLDLLLEMADSPFFHLLPLSLPWTVLYRSLLSLWESGDVAMETPPDPNIEDTTTTVPMETDNEGAPGVMTNQEGGVSGGSLGLQFLCEAHDQLGMVGQGWCVGEDGRLLKILVRRLREELHLLTTHPPRTREGLLKELEQCYYCLYGHPHRKAKAWGLQDHGAEQLPLTWESAQVLLEFYHPSFLPAVEENRALTPELVSLYKRLIDIIPVTGKVIPLTVIAGYIEGNIEELPLPSSPASHTTLISEIFYLLADDALKSSEYFLALQNYTQSVCYCPERVDTWAGLALARARTVMKKLDRRDLRSGIESTVQKQVTPILRCFKRALALGSQHHYISEKYGLFCYTVQSYCSQIISMPDLYAGKAELVSWARRSRRGLLQLARQCFSSALSQVGGVSKPWFYGVVAGKAGVKLGLAPADTLPLLISVARELSSGETTPPATIELRGQWMALVEVHYQIYSCALKYLLRDNMKVEQDAVAKAMVDWQGSPLCGVGYPGVSEWVAAVLGGVRPRPLESELTRQPQGRDSVTLLVERVIASAEREVALETGTSDHIKATPTNLLERCLYGVAMVTIRCPAYYKSLYRLASVFHHLGHSQEARSLLLGPLPQVLLRAQDKLQPLFVLKPNIFANFWQIPVEEINRPGRFCSSARASLQMLCEVLSQQKDSASLLLLVQHLRCRPDSSRQYLRDYERVVMCKKAIRCCTSVHEAILREAGSCTTEKLRALLLEIHSLRTHSQRSDSKHHSLTKAVEESLVQCYQIYRSRPIDPRVGVVSARVGTASAVEEVTRYCQAIIRQQTDNLLQK